MKTYLISILLLIIMATSCQERIDIESTEKEIIAVLDKEVNAVLEMNPEAFPDAWIQDESAVFISAGSNDYQTMFGFKKIGSWFKNGKQKAKSHGFVTWKEIT